MEVCRVSNYNNTQTENTIKMEETNNNLRKDIISHYMNHVLEHGSKPANIHKFAKENGMNENDFYQFFTSFEVLEKEIFNEFFNQTLLLLDKNEEYHSYDSQNKLLSFYFTFFEIITRNRSYVLQCIGHDSVNTMHTLSILRRSFKTFIETLQIETVNLRNNRLENYKEKGLTEAYWGQLIFIFNYWKNDSSPAFEKTDILIEKMVNTSFQIQDIKPLESMLDLGKFLYKEMINR